MTDLVEFIDANGKKKKAVYLKLMKHKVKDVVNNKEIDEWYVEAVIPTRHRKDMEGYPVYIPFGVFHEKNPELAEDLFRRRLIK